MIADNYPDIASRLRLIETGAPAREWLEHELRHWKIGDSRRVKVLFGNADGYRAFVAPEVLEADAENGWVDIVVRDGKHRIVAGAKDRLRGYVSIILDADRIALGVRRSPLSSIFHDLPRVPSIPASQKVPAYWGMDFGRDGDVHVDMLVAPTMKTVDRRIVLDDKVDTRIADAAIAKASAETVRQWQELMFQALMGGGGKPAHTRTAAPSICRCRVVCACPGA